MRSRCAMRLRNPNDNEGGRLGAALAISVIVVAIGLIYIPWWVVLAGIIVTVGIFKVF